MSSLHPSDPEDLLNKIKNQMSEMAAWEIRARELEDGIDDYSPDDPERLRLLQELMQCKMEFARQFTALAIVKAKLGIVGISWFERKQ